MLPLSKLGQSKLGQSKLVLWGCELWDSARRRFIATSHLNDLPLGKRGEHFAMQLLKTDGYRILAHGWQHRTGELDLVVRRGSTIAFVEVKTRAVPWAFAERDGPIDFSGPLAAVDARKQRQVARAAAEWWHRHAIDSVSLRFDVVAVLIDSTGQWQGRHLPAAFESPL